MKQLLDKFVGMNAETRGRTVTAFIVAVLDFLAAFHILEFTQDQYQAILKIVLVLTTAFVWAYCSHYKNNDYTEEACIGTGVTRQLKIEKDPKYIGDRFYTEYCDLNDPEAVKYVGDEEEMTEEESVN